MSKKISKPKTSPKGLGSKKTKLASIKPFIIKDMKKPKKLTVDIP